MTQATDIIRPTYFDVPDITKRPGQLLDVADIHEGIAFLEPTGLYEGYNCLNVGNQAVLPCPPAFLAAPVQAASSTSTTLGTLAAGTYRAKVTAINSRGETVGSNEISQVTTGATSRITWNWAAVSGATGYRIYRTAVGGGVGTETFLTEVGLVTTYVDDGSVILGTKAVPATSTATVVITKTDTAATWQDGIRFAVYGLVKCKPLGTFSPNGDTNAEAELRRIFEATESVGVERAIMQQRMIVNGTAWPAATDITPTPGTPVSPAQALALLEGHAASRYAGVPTIHAPRSIASMLSHLGAIQRVGDAFHSNMGSKVAAGGGYDSPPNGPTGAAPAAGNLWVFATGEVAVARSELLVASSMKYDSNEMYSLAEREYVATVDCYTAAVLTSVTA